MSRLAAWLSVCVLAGNLSAATAAAIPVAPGSVVRWPGAEITECGIAQRRWEPLGAECWYPIDLLEPEGEIEVVRWLADGSRELRTVIVTAYPYEVQHITLKDDSQVNLSAADLERVAEENRKIAALWSRETARQFELPLAAPLEQLPEGGRFGARRFFNNQPRSPHSGADYSAESGTRILAVAAGTVVLTGDFFFPGRSVFIDHGDGLISMYFHMSGVAVEPGERVERGETIGLVGTSGRATGPHLHLGLRWHGERIDPRALLQPVSAVSTIR